MIRRLIKYSFKDWLVEDCGCLSNNASTYILWENGVLLSEDNWLPVCEEEQDLRAELKHLEPFDVHSECEWF